MATSSGKPLREGDPAPEIELLTDRGQPFRLSNLRGKNVILFFYPKAGTPGCTTEACEFRDAAPRFEAAETVIVGVSPDPPGPQAKFKTKYGLPFTLLCDTDHAAAAAYGVWRAKKMYGNRIMGVERSTFVIGEDGRIRRIYGKVRAQGHAARVLSDLSAL